MKYVYPLLPDFDCYLFRLGGAGMGNNLFAYARAIVFARDHGCRVIWPTWWQIKIGTILRNEPDKRFYWDQFHDNTGCIHGLHKLALMLTKPRVTEDEARKGADLEGKVVIFEDFVELFTPIMRDSAYVREDLIRNLQKRNRKAVDFKPEKAICMHVRLGDFQRATWEEVLAGNHDSSIPIEWYVQIAKELRRISGKDNKIYVFSDGTDKELAPLLALPNVERITFGTAIADIIALSNAPLLVASGSSFSMWARYLGRMTTVMFPNQVKQAILLPEEETKEITAVDHIDEQYNALIQKTLG